MTSPEVAVVPRVYRPRGACLSAFTSRAPEILVSGPAGTGKSRALLEKIHLQAMKYPGMRGLVIRKTASTLGSTTLVTWREHVTREARAAGMLRYYGGSGSEAAQYKYTNGSSITIGGMDKATKIMSSEYDVAYVGEAIELRAEDWEAITTRLRNGVMPYQQIYADTNPDAPHHWLKKRCDAGQTLLLESRHEDNPVYFNDDRTMTDAGRDYIEGKLDRLTGVRYHRLRSGLWVASEGIVYEGWDPAVHLLDRFEIPSDWPRFWVVDFGFKNPFVCQWWARDPDGRLYMYREIYWTGKLVEDHARDILKLVRRGGGTGDWLEPQPTRVICDHDAEGRATLEKYLARPTVAANKKVLEGIQAVQKRLQPAGDGRPRLFLVRGATVRFDPGLLEARKPVSTEQEMAGYIWDVGSGRSPKEQPLKENDHGMDTTRYVVADHDLVGQPNVRWV